MTTEKHVDFVPSRVEGFPDVSEVFVFPDRLELRSNGELAAFRFIDMVEWPSPRWLWKLLTRFGWRKTLMVGERDWFHPPAERYFRFFTKPALVVSLADEPNDLDYGSTLFYRIQQLISRGGFNTWDLG